MDFNAIILIYGAHRKVLSMSTNYSRTPTGIYNVVPPVLQDGDFAETQVDVNGKIKVETSGTAVITGSVDATITNTVTVTGTVDTNLNGLDAFATTQYTVGVAAVQLTPTPLANRTSIIVKVVTTSSANAVYVGNSSGVTTITGFPLFNGDALEMDLTAAHSIYAIGSAAAQEVFVLELG